jgi:hypothetical protein
LCEEEVEGIGLLYALLGFGGGAKERNLQQQQTSAMEMK